MKKVIILFFVILLCGCSAEKPAKTMSSMQTETTVAETAVPEEMTKLTSKETETVIETPKEEPPAPIIIERPEQNATPEITTETITETTTEQPKAQKSPAETVKEEEPTEIPESVETPPESVTEPPKAEFDINYWIDFARSYALQVGLEIDETAADCWDNPTTANADCIYLERDLKSRLNRYENDEDITAVNVWAESLGNGNYLIYIAYA